MTIEIVFYGYTLWKFYRKLSQNEIFLLLIVFLPGEGDGGNTLTSIDRVLTGEAKKDYVLCEYQKIETTTPE